MSRILAPSPEPNSTRTTGRKTILGMGCTRPISGENSRFRDCTWPNPRPMGAARSTAAAIAARTRTALTTKCCPSSPSGTGRRKSGTARLSLLTGTKNFSAKTGSTSQGYGRIGRFTRAASRIQPPTKTPRPHSVLRHVQRISLSVPSAGGSGSPAPGTESSFCNGVLPPLDCLSGLECG